MLIKSTENLTKIILPKSEWWQDVSEMLTKSGLEIKQKKRGLYGLLPQLKLLFVLCRPSEVADLTSEPDSQAVFGITGSDCLAERELTAKYSGNMFAYQALRAMARIKVPQPYQVIPTRQQPKVTLFATPNAVSQKTDGVLQNPGAIVSVLPNFTRFVLEERDAINQVQVIPVAGSAEARWLLAEPNWRGRLRNPMAVITGVVDVRQTGESAEGSELTPLEALIAVNLVGLLSEENANPIDRRRVNTLVEILNSTDYKGIFRELMYGNYRNSRMPESALPKLLNQLEDDKN